MAVGWRFGAALGSITGRWDMRRVHYKTGKKAGFQTHLDGASPSIVAFSLPYTSLPQQLRDPVMVGY
jgi:hypothetical protein